MFLKRLVYVNILLLILSYTTYSQNKLVFNQGHSNGYIKQYFSIDNQFTLTLDKNQQILKFWLAKNNTLLRTITTKNKIEDFVLSYDKTKIITAEERGVITIFNSATGNVIANIKQIEGGFISFAHKKNIFFTTDGGDISVINIWSSENYVKLKQIKTFSPCSLNSPVLIDKTDNFLAYTTDCYTGKKSYLIDIGTQKPIAYFDDFDGSTDNAIYFNDKNNLIVNTKSKIVIYSITNKSNLRTISKKNLEFNIKFNLNDFYYLYAEKEKIIVKDIYTDNLIAKINTNFKNAFITKNKTIKLYNKDTIQEYNILTKELSPKRIKRNELEFRNEFAIKNQSFSNISIKDAAFNLSENKVYWTEYTNTENTIYSFNFSSMTYNDFFKVQDLDIEYFNINDSLLIYNTSSSWSRDYGIKRESIILNRKNGKKVSLKFSKIPEDYILDISHENKSTIVSDLGHLQVYDSTENFICSTSDVFDNALFINENELAAYKSQPSLYNQKNLYLYILSSKTGSLIKAIKTSQTRINGISYTNNHLIVYGDKVTDIINLNSNKLIFSIPDNSLNIRNVQIYKNNKAFVISKNKSIRVYDIYSKKNIITLYLFDNKKDWVSITPSGYFDGTELGIKNLHFVNRYKVIPLDNLYEHFFMPNLFKRVIQGEKFKGIDINNLNPAPQIRISSLEKHNNSIDFKSISINKYKSLKREIQIPVKIIEEGGGIDEIRLFVNGKLVETTNRGFKAIENKNANKIKTFTISLTNGENKIKVIAFNNQRTESIPDEITVYFEGTEKSSDLYLIVIGIDNYKNPRYKLNYAIADASGFKKEIENGSNNIFESVNTTYIKNEKATRAKILQEFEKLKLKIKPEDVFIFYYAGHGVMSEEKKSQFYIIPYDITQLYGNNEMLKANAISANELQSFSMELKAQKQLFIFDACQSGGMTELLASRGAAEEKAIAQLARSTGSYWLAASNSDQFATEFTELGHGIFTYSILLGLQGQADGGSKDKKITVKELSAFLNDKVPELSEKYKGSAQYPNSYGFGQDFPIITVKQ